MNSENTAAIPTKDEFIALLKNGKIEEFNRVRPAGEIDLRKANLAGADLWGANLTEVILIGADLTEANLARADLRWANLCKADLTEADLTGAKNLIGANLFEVKGLSEEQRRLIIHKLQASWK